ncbi:MAG: heparin lyase I family protein [Bauldia sp.]|nr:heparin lyase I family protein [Bauldia sp.]
MSDSTISSFSDDNGSKFNIGSVTYRVQNADESWSLDLVDDSTLRFTLKPDDVWKYDSSTRERTEIASTEIFKPGEDISFGYQFMIEDGAKNTADWLLVGQMHANDLTTSPPFAVEMKGEKMAIMIRYQTKSGDTVSTYVYKDSQDIERGHYYSMKVEANFSTSGGYLHVWRDGVQIVDYQGPLGYDNGVYWKEGVYRSESNETLSVNFRDLTFGNHEVQVAQEPGDGKTIEGTNGSDNLVGTPNSDKIDAAGGDDTVTGIEGSDTLLGSGGKDVIRGSDGNDKIIGGKSKDKLDGGRGNDSLKGCGGKDTFIFEENFGKDKIKDFKAGKDKIDLGDFFSSFDDLKGAMDGKGHKVVIDSDEGTIILKGVKISDLDHHDFILNA